MKVKKTHKNGQCDAMRCAQMTPNRFCARHQKEFEAEGITEDGPAASKKLTSGELSEARQAALAAERAQLTEALAIATSLPLDTDAQIMAAQAIQNKAHESIKTLTKEMKSVLDPLKEVQDTIKGWFVPNIDTYKAIKDCLARRIGSALSDREKARNAALLQIQNSASDAPPEAFAAAHAQLSAPMNSGGRTDTYEIEVVDFDALPSQFKIQVVDVPALRAAVKANPDQAIPGVKVTVVPKTKVG